MKREIKNRVRFVFGWIVLLVFLGSLTIKPIHVLLDHHKLGVEMNTRSNEKTITNHHPDCAICDFEFYTFIQQNQEKLQDSNQIFAKEPAPKLTSCIPNQASHHFLLRAPPVF